jgi:predicted nucleic acid-binding protein
LDLVCLDTQILIWGIQEEASPGQEDMIRRATYLFRLLTQSKTTIIISSIVVGEFLVGIPLNMHRTVVNLIGQGFVTAPFDLQAAAEFARLWDDRQKRNIIRDLQEIQKATREELKVDCLIVATAIAQKASCIYSCDGKLKAFAAESIPVIELPMGEEQLDLGLPGRA